MAKVAEGTSVAELLRIMVDADRKALSAPKKLHELRLQDAAPCLALVLSAHRVWPTAGDADARAECATLATEAQEIAWDQLHTGEWRSVPAVWRLLYACAARLHAACAWPVDAGIPVGAGARREVVRQLDMAIMFEGPHRAQPTHAVIDAIHRAYGAEITASCGSEGGGRKRRRPSDVEPSSAAVSSAPVAHQTVTADEGETSHARCGDTEDGARPGKIPRHVPVPRGGLCTPIPKLELPGLTQFRTELMERGLPAIITGAMSHWPAMGAGDGSRAWNNLRYLKSAAGLRTVPVEIGDSYMDDKWAQRLMTLADFIDKHVDTRGTNSGASAGAGAGASAGAGAPGYLAQHPLFDQVPALRHDIDIPDYCMISLSDAPCDDGDIAINAWFGPGGTVSNLHQDPKHNLLCQVVGRKRIRLYAVEHSESMYPHDGLMSNTSQVDAENPDEGRFPKFVGAPFWMGELNPGDMLYIPPKMWHHVRSLATSFSVSFWWE